MNTYLVTLADRQTGKSQRILVQSSSEEGMEEFIRSAKVLPTLELDDPTVVAIHRLRVKRPARGTVLPSLVMG